MREIAIHPSNKQKGFEFNNDDLDDIESESLLFKMNYYVNADDQKKYYLYDVTNKTILSKSEEVTLLKIPEDTLALILNDVSPKDFNQINIPKNTQAISFRGLAIMIRALSKTEKNKDTIQWLEGRIDSQPDQNVDKKNEDFFKHTKKIENIADYGISELLSKIQKSNIHILSIDHFYLSNSNFELLSENEKLKCLEISYFFNKNPIKKLPKSLIKLSVKDGYLDAFSNIDLELPNLEQLDLSDNSLIKLDDLNNLKNLRTLNLYKNKIDNFPLKFLPKSLEELNLSYNRIDYYFFDQVNVNENIKVLKLKNNGLVITFSILSILLKMFPNLESLELFSSSEYFRSNRFLGLKSYSLDGNCLEHIKNLIQEPFSDKLKEEMLKNTDLNINEFIKLEFYYSSVPSNVLLQFLRKSFYSYFLVLPNYKEYSNGFSCCVDESTKSVVQIIVNNESNQLFFNIYSNDSNSVYRNFYKYIEDITSIINTLSHDDIFPEITTSESCLFLKEKYLGEMGLYDKVNKDLVLKFKDNNFEILINNLKIESRKREDKFVGKVYYSSKDIAFILITNKGAYPFVVKENILTNTHKIIDHYCHYFVSLTAYKTTFKKSIGNSYLNSNIFFKSEIHINKDENQKVECYINKSHFEVQENVLVCKNIKNLKLDGANFISVNIKDNKYCKFYVEMDKIYLKYTLK
jgi:hypothetical protein